MAAPLLAGLARIATGLGRGAARSGAKKLAVRKIKSVAKDKVKLKAKDKLSKKSKLLSSKGDQQEQKLKYSSVSGELTPTLTGTTDPVKIKSASSSKSQVEQLKINVTNIHSFLVKSNKQYKKQEADTRRNETVRRSKVKLRGEERRLEKRSSPLAKSASIVKGAMQPAKSLFDRLMDFAGALLLGILVNALPAIVNKVKEIVDNIVNFLTPIQSGFNLVKGFFTGDLDESKYDADKKRFSDGMDNINKQIDKVSEKMGPLGEIIKIFKPVVDLLGFGGKKVVLAKQDGKEGFLNKETGAFTEKQFTSEERTRYESQNETPTSNQDEKLKPKSSPDNKPVKSQIQSPVGPITPGGTLDFIGSGDGASGTLVLNDQKGKKLGSWEAISGVFRTANASQEDRRNVSGTLNPLPDGTYPLMGFAKHGYIGGVGTWSTYINNMTGSIGSRSQLLVHNDIGSNGTAGCVGVELGGRSGTDAENKFLKLYEAAKPTSIRVAIGKGAKKLTAQAKPKRSTDNTPVTTARIDSIDKKSKQINSINQSMDDEGTTTIAVQQVNTIQTQVVPTPVQVASAPPQSAPLSQLTSLWTL